MCFCMLYVFIQIEIVWTNKPLYNGELKNVFIRKYNLIIRIKQEYIDEEVRVPFELLSLLDNQSLTVSGVTTNIRYP